MSKNNITFSAFCDQLGIPLRNPRWSWSAHDPSNSRFLFTIWDNEILAGGETYQLWNTATDDVRTDNGARELRRNSIAASAPDAEAYGIRCFPKYPLTHPRKRDYFDENDLIRLEVGETDGRYVARFLGVCPPEVLIADVELSTAMLPSALDDFDAPIGVPAPPRLTKVGEFYARDPKVREAVVKRAKGRCEYCGQLGFETSSGKRFVETHHIIQLANQGPDTVDNVIGLCPNHHRQAHYGANQVELEMEFQSVLAKHYFRAS